MIILKVFKQSLIIRNKKHTALRNALYKNNKNKSQPGNQCTEPMLFHTEDKMMMMEVLTNKELANTPSRTSNFFYFKLPETLNSCVRREGGKQNSILNSRFVETMTTMKNQV